MIQYDDNQVDLESTQRSNLRLALVWDETPVL